MAVTLVGPGSTTGNTALVTSRAVAVPNNGGANPLQANDVVVVRLSRWDSSLNPAVTAPSGFVHLTQVTQAGGAKIDTYLKRLTAADTGTYSFSWLGSMWSTATARAYRGVDTAATLTAVPLHQVTNTGTSWPAATLSSVAAGVLDWHGYSESNGNPHTQPTGFTKLTDNDSDVAAYQIVTAGSYTTSGGSAVANSNNVVSMLHLPAAGAGGNSNPAGVAAETDAEQTAGRIRATATGLATETDAGQAAGRIRATPVGVAGETDTALPSTDSHTNPAGVALETDTGVDAGRTRATSVGIAAETDTAISPGRSRATAAGVAAETDQAQPAGSAGATPAGQAAETDQALSPGRVRVTAAGVALETDQGVTAGRTRTIPAGAGTETDTALAAGRSRSTGAAVAVESDAALDAGDPNAIILDLLLEASTDPGPWRVAVEPDRYVGDTEPDRWRTEVQAS